MSRSSACQRSAQTKRDRIQKRGAMVKNPPYRKNQKFFGGFNTDGGNRQFF
nr:MAG TPA: hypothetical protein [Caudoviricetes sp.]